MGKAQVAHQGVFVWLARAGLWMLLAAAIVPAAAAQATRVEGIVRDASGTAVSGAHVELQAKGYSASASTDSSGSFIFDGVPVTSGTIVVTAKGFQKLQQPWSAAVGATAELQLAMSPATVSQQVVVTAARTQTPLGETPISVTQLTQKDLQATPALTLNDKLRQIPGFSLFRRSSSRIANPGTMGASLRGLGGSAASRVLVLEDGIPLNDPFGSWVYWDRVPDMSVSSVEVLQGGASSLYGSDALAGVIQFLTRPPEPATLSVEASYGNQNTPDLSLWTSGVKGPWEASFGGEVFSTDGYILVPGAYRGSVNVPANSEDGTADLMIVRKIGEQSQVFARGWYFNDARGNGTPLQNNNIQMGEGALGANLDLGSAGSLQLRFYGEAETYHQTFSSVATNQNSETLTDTQTVPAQGVGGSALWRRNLGRRQTIVAGLDDHEEIGRSNDLLALAHKDNSSGGHQRTTGVFGEDLIQIAPSWLLTVSTRFDNWRNFDGSLYSIGAAPGSTGVNTLYASRSYQAFSPRASLLHQFNSHVAWSASVYRAFRAPTLNELYRPFRVGITETENNPLLNAERLTGVDAGVDVTGFNRRLEVRGTFFYNQIIDGIENVEIGATPPPPATPTLITAEKMNLGRTTSPGFEIDVVDRLADRFLLSGGYEYIDATVSSFPRTNPTLQPNLVGLWVPQVSHNQLTFQAEYSNPSFISFSVDGRYMGKQYDDATNFYSMGSFFVLDAEASHQLRHGLEIFTAFENLFNAQYFFANTPPVPSRGLPIAGRVGFRLDLARR